MLKKILVLSFIITLNAWAGKVARVVEVKGKAFIMTPKGTSFTLKKDYHIELGSDIMTEQGGQITLVNYKDQYIHLGSGSHIAFEKSGINVKNGNLWLQSKRNDAEMKLFTTNSKVKFNNADFILNYNSFDGKTQVFVLNGHVDFSNFYEPMLKTDITAGKFSYISPDYNEGIPRRPVQVGRNSFIKVTKIFNSIKPIGPGDVFHTRKTYKKKRSIASVKKVMAKKKNNKSKILFISSKSKKKLTTERVPNSVAPVEVAPAPKKVMKKRVSKKKYTAPSGVRVFGANIKDMMNKKSIKVDRLPSSIPNAVPKTSVKTNKNDLVDDLEKAFVDSYNEYSTQQPKHPKQVNELIDELDQYDNDFDVNY